MIESIKALVVIFAASLGGFIFASMAFRELIDRKRLTNWRNAYLIATVAAFIIPNFWLVLFALALIAIAHGAKENVRPAMYLVLLFTMPVASAVVPGFAGINNFLTLYPFNILALVLLLPLIPRQSETRAHANVGLLADICFTVFSLLMLALSFRDTSITNGFRQSIAYILTAFGPYVVFSRWNWTKENLKVVSLAFVIPLGVLSGVAIVEVALGWHFFLNAVDNWGIWFHGRYTSRGGFLRAYTSIFGPITFGLYLAAAVPLALALITVIRKRTFAIIGLCAICAALLVTVSRGPWVGAVFAAIVFVATSQRMMSNMVRLGVIGLAGLVVLALTPFGDNIFALIPFINEDTSGSFDYRQRLAEIGWSVAMETPVFGSENYLNHPRMQQLIQGQGIIDLVNSYLRIALESGLVGLALYVGLSVFSLMAAFSAIGRARKFDPELAIYAQGWFAALAGFLVIIATTSNVVAQVAEVHLLLCGMCIGIARSVALAAAEAGRAPAVPPPSDDAPPPDAPPPSSRPSAPAPASLPPHLRQYGRRT